VTTSWFATRELPHGVFLVAEPGHVNSFLVVGEERSALVDSGLGIASIRAAVAALTDRPVVVVNTHHHFDHVGGNAEFGETAIHELGAGPLAEPVPAAHLDEYMAFVRDLTANVAAYRELDERFFSFLSDETTPRPLPDGFDPAAWAIEPPPPGRLLREGDEIDLGGRSLRVVHTPGHTPDSICLLDEREGILFGGDTINTGPIYAHMTDSSLEAFTASTARLAEIAGAVRVVYVAHFSRYAADARFLVEVADGFLAICSGDAEWRDAADFAGDPVREARFTTFSVFLPAPH
jgi:glyoxylase-like metal-dependent hydrolase (beta-lactamase superfamily II)